MKLLYVTDSINIGVCSRTSLNIFLGKETVLKYFLDEALFVEPLNRYKDILEKTWTFPAASKFAKLFVPLTLMYYDSSAKVRVACIAEVIAFSTCVFVICLWDSSKSTLSVYWHMKSCWTVHIRWFYWILEYDFILSFLDNVVEKKKAWNIYLRLFHSYQIFFYLWSRDHL